MVARFFGRQIAALVVALGMLLNGLAPAGAMPAGFGGNAMPGMAMSGDCMDSADKAMPGKESPSRNTDRSCAVCASCAVNIAPALELIPAPFLCRDTGLGGADVNPDGIVIPPALPPPILRA